jgi:hypothetical protein
MPGIFTDTFLSAIRGLITVHHSIYPDVPPQGIYFESLVEKALRDIHKPFAVIPTARNSPQHDLLVDGVRLSIKSETGKATRLNRITMTKLCTTEREPWTAEMLIQRTMEHLGRYDVILMLRSIWSLPLLHYQLLEIPVSTLKLIENTQFGLRGTRKGRQSLGADVLWDDGAIAFHVHFDGSDGKCSIRNLDTKYCIMLAEWDTVVHA